MFDEPTVCRHCGTPIPPQRSGRPRVHPYCCATLACMRAAANARARASDERHRQRQPTGPITVEELLALRWSPPDVGG